MMEAGDLEVLSRALEWLRAGQRVVLATVVETWGSSPRPVGALWAVAAREGLAGSVSGGCVEEELTRRIRAGELAAAGPEVVTYGLDPTHTERYGLPCGGVLRLVLEPLADADALAELVGALRARRLVRRTLEIASGAVRCEPAAAHAPAQFDGQRLVTHLGPQWRLLLIGAGHLSQYVARYALTLEFEVTVCDPRPEYLAGWPVTGVALASSMPDDLIAELGMDARSAVVALTHDPRYDDMALMQALDSPAFYVGALGSRANTRRRLERLAQLEVSAEGRARLHGPVGLPIGARTAPEIALSIVSELVAARHGCLTEQRELLPRKPV